MKRSEVCLLVSWGLPSFLNSLQLFIFNKEISGLMLLQISYDIIEDIMVQGDRIRDTLQELQDAVYLTKVIRNPLSHSLRPYFYHAHTQ